MDTKKLVVGYGVSEPGRRELQDSGAAIREYRSRHGYTQSQLGDAVGLGKAQISRIEGRDNLTVGTVSRLLGAMGAKAYIQIEEPKEDIDAFVTEAVEVIAAFAGIHNLTLNRAYSYLETFGGLAFLREFFAIEQSYTLDETVEHLSLICRQKGGAL
ncbi:MAG: DUF3791 domain-containing protein [Bacteroidales bacterium]|nr:DUF3791 domain-containing protein [Bacteroidales bacterium]